MKTKIVLLLIIQSINYSCNRQNNCDKGINNLQTILEYTQAIYHHHTDYLTATELKEKRFNGEQLLKILSKIDSITSGKETSELYYRYDIDGNNNIAEVTLVSPQFDLGFRVELDSFLIHLNKEFFLIKLTKADSLQLIQADDSLKSLETNENPDGMSW